MNKIFVISLLYVSIFSHSLYAAEMQVFDPPSNIRDKPGGKILCTINEVTNIETLGKKGEWFITDTCGAIGVIHESQVKIYSGNSISYSKDKKVTESNTKSVNSYDANYAKGNCVKMSGTVVFGLVDVTVKGFIEDVAGDRIKIYISDTGGQNVHYNGSYISKGDQIWDEKSGWSVCN